jgi:hypothetical protein
MTTQAASHNLTVLAKDRRIAFTVWITVSLITIAGGHFAPSHDSGANHRNVLVAVVVLLGFLKSLLIAHHYMDLRHAPRWLQLSTQGWLAVLWLTLLVIYYVT